MDTHRIPPAGSLSSKEPLFITIEPTYHIFPKEGDHSHSFQVSTNALYFRIAQEDVETFPWAFPKYYTSEECPGGRIPVICGLNEGMARSGSWLIQAFDREEDFNTRG